MKKIFVIFIIIWTICIICSCENDITDPITITIINKLSNKDSLIITGTGDWTTDEIKPGESSSYTIQRGTEITATGKGDKKFIISHIFTDDKEVWTIKD